MKNLLLKLKDFIKLHKITTLVVGVAVILAVGVVVYERFYTPVFQNSPLNIKQKVEKPKPNSILTGLPIEENLLNRRPLAVVIENSTDARPQSGYIKADVVYETLAEGGITRTLAIFQSQDSNEIGPVRSARDYFVDWLSELKAVFVHVGGSADALDRIKANNVPDLNQFYYGNYFWRSTDRVAPHNVYTTTAKLYDAVKKAGYDQTVNGLKWYEFKKDADQASRPQSQNITINFSGPLYTSSYAYDPTNNDYVRSVAGVAAKDKATGEQVRSKNIIVEFKSIVPGKSRAGEQKVNITTIGKGSGLLFQDGKATKITWEKTDRESLTKLTDENGNSIKLNPGQTWIEVPEIGATVTY